jgi:glutathione S-transferase
MTTVKAALATPGEARFHRTLTDIERLAQGPGPWLLGDSFTAVDAYALVIWRWAERRRIDTSAYPAWSAKAARALARPSVKRALQKEAAQPEGRLMSRPDQTLENSSLISARARP